MSKFRFRLHYDILYDYKTAELPDRQWRRFIELVVIAGKYEAGGWLPEVGKIAQLLHKKKETIIPDLEYLADRGFIGCRQGRYFIPNFDPNGMTWPVQRHTAFKDEVYTRDGGQCVYCGDPAEHLDHIVPRSKDGKDKLTNLVAACSDCNRSKKNQDLVTWYKSRDYFDPARLTYVLSILNQKEAIDG